MIGCLGRIPVLLLIQLTVRIILLLVMLWMSVVMPLA